jgi:hypothetical protein
MNARSIIVKIFGELYSLNTSERDRIGVWIDLTPANILITTKKEISADNDLIWNLMNKGNMEFVIDLQMNPIQVEDFQLSVLIQGTCNLS